MGSTVHLTRSPAQLARTMADLQCTNELLLEKNGSLEARFVDVCYVSFRCCLLLFALSDVPGCFTFILM